MKFKDIEEEDSILKSVEFDEETKLKLPSLYVLHQLSPENFETVVMGLTVNDLAEAWLGPLWIKSAILARLSARKREVLEQVQSSVKASRHSNGFQKALVLCTPFHANSDHSDLKAVA